MHFWIDKPTGRYRGFNGRRYPVMSLAKSSHLGGQHRRSGNVDVGRMQMVTPVHRLQNNGGSSAGPSNHSSARPSRSNTQHSNDSRSNSAHGLQLGQELVSNNPNIPGNNQQLPQTNNETNRNLSNFSEFSDTEMSGYRLRCSVWFIFVLATGFVAAARFYFDHQQGAGLEVLVFCGLLVLVLIIGCFFSIICRHAQNNHRHQGTQSEPITTVTVVNTIPNESIRQVSMPVRQNPPPPYHIAILIPPPTPDEAPPPAYDKIIQ